MGLASFSSRRRPEFQGARRREFESRLSVQRRQRAVLLTDLFTPARSSLPSGKALLEHLRNWISRSQVSTKSAGLRRMPCHGLSFLVLSLLRSLQSDFSNSASPSTVLRSCPSASPPAPSNLQTPPQDPIPTYRVSLGWIRVLGSRVSEEVGVPTLASGLVSHCAPASASPSLRLSVSLFPSRSVAITLSRPPSRPSLCCVLLSFLSCLGPLCALWRCAIRVWLVSLVAGVPLGLQVDSVVGQEPALWCNMLDVDKKTRYF